MTKAKLGRQTCVSSPSLTLWKTSGREFIAVFLIIIIKKKTTKKNQTNGQTCNPCDPCVLRLYNHIQLSSNLMSGCDYSLFKVGLLLYCLFFFFFFLMATINDSTASWIWCNLLTLLRRDERHGRILSFHMYCKSVLSSLRLELLLEQSRGVFNSKPRLML